MKTTTILAVAAVAVFVVLGVTYIVATRGASTYTGSQTQVVNSSTITTYWSVAAGGIVTTRKLRVTWTAAIMAVVTVVAIAAAIFLAMHGSPAPGSLLPPLKPPNFVGV